MLVHIQQFSMLKVVKSNAFIMLMVVYCDKWRICEMLVRRPQAATCKLFYFEYKNHDSLSIFRSHSLYKLNLDRIEWVLSKRLPFDFI